MNKPLMIYVFSDGSLSANGMVNNTVEGRGKLDWASDNQSTAAPFVLVYRPGNRPQMRSATRLQIGSLSAGGDVVTISSPAANAVNLLVESVILNYMALHGEKATSPRCSRRTAWVARRCATTTMIAPVCNGTVSSPV
jgi:hypothetical protein